MDLFTLSTVLIPAVDNPDDPTGGNPDATIIDGERLDPDDVDVSEGDDDEDDLDSDDTPEVDSYEEDDPDEAIDYKTRHGDAVRWGQQQKKRADDLEARINRLKNQGVNLEEIESLLPPEERSMASPDIQNLASKQDLAQMAQTIQWNMARGAFLADNVEFRKDKELGAELEFQAAKVIQEDVRVNGALTLSPDKVYRKAAKAVKARVKALENKGKKKATQTRQKVKSQGSDMGGDTSKRAGKGSEEEKAFDPRSSYMSYSKL